MSEERFCLTCDRRDGCQAICPLLESYLKLTCDTQHSVNARPFACLPKSVRVSVGSDKYGNPNALLYGDEREIADDD